MHPFFAHHYLHSIEKKNTYVYNNLSLSLSLSLVLAFDSSELVIMQQVSSSPIQTSRYHQYPTVPILPSTSSSSSLLIPQYSALNSPQSIKSIDATVFGPNIPSFKNSKIVNNPSNSSSSRSNDVDLRRLILFNLPIDLIREYLELYLEHLSGEAEIERIDYSNLEDTTVMVTFKTELG
jgi:hypothetical protein